MKKQYTVEEALQLVIDKIKEWDGEDIKAFLIEYLSEDYNTIEYEGDGIFLIC